MYSVRLQNVSSKFYALYMTSDDMSELQNVFVLEFCSDVLYNFMVQSKLPV